MTSADDFHLISWRNFFGLAVIVVAVLIPVGLRYVWKKELQSVAQADTGEEPPVEVEAQAPLYGYEAAEEDDDDIILQSGPSVVNKGKQVAVLGDVLSEEARLILLPNDEEAPEILAKDESSDEDEVLQTY